MSCKEIKFAFEDVSEKNEECRESFCDEDKIHFYKIHFYKNKTMYVPKRSSRLLREFSYKKQLQTEGPDCLDMLGAKLEHLQSHDKVLSNEMEQLKMSFERMAERYMAQKREKEALQNIIQELNLCILQQLNAADGEKVLCHITFKRHSKKSMMRIVYSKPGRRRRQPSIKREKT